VALFAPLTQGPFELHQRVIETNLFGAMFGARAVIPVFRRQRQGVLINVGSVLSKVGQPFVPSYVISKFGLRGLSESLRAELADEPDIHVCTLFPYAIDTPHFQTAANETGRDPRAMPPAQSPEKVARALVALAEHPHRERHVPRIAAAGVLLHELFPHTTEQLLLHALRRWHFSGGGQGSSVGDLYSAPSGQREVHGARPPQLSTVSFALWSARELLKLKGQGVARRARRAQHATPP